MNPKGEIFKSKGRRDMGMLSANKKSANDLQISVE